MLLLPLEEKLARKRQKTAGKPLVSNETKGRALAYLIPEFSY